MITPPARQFLNTSFTETAGSRQREGVPCVLVHRDDAVRLGIADGAMVRLGNARGEVMLRAQTGTAAQRGVVVVEGIWPNDAYPGGIGINQLIGADPMPPAGGCAFHDTAVWLRPQGSAWPLPADPGVRGSGSSGTPS